MLSCLFSYRSVEFQDRTLYRWFASNRLFQANGWQETVATETVSTQAAGVLPFSLFDCNFSSVLVVSNLIAAKLLTSDVHVSPTTTKWDVSINFHIVLAKKEKTLVRLRNGKKTAYVIFTPCICWCSLLYHLYQSNFWRLSNHFAVYCLKLPNLSARFSFVRKFYGLPSLSSFSLFAARYLTKK